METMEARMVKLYARNNNHVALHAIPGHFATSHSHINFYIDMTSLKTRANEAQEVAKSLAGDYVNSTVVDTIVCMDGTEVVGAYLAQEFEKRGFRNTNLHDTIYVVTPEYNANNQLIFRDNTIPAIKGKNVIAAGNYNDGTDCAAQSGVRAVLWRNCSWHFFHLQYREESWRHGSAFCIQCG